jgi:putative transposase
LAISLTRSERSKLVDLQQAELPIATQASLLGLNRSSLYYRPVPPSLAELALKRRIDEIYTAYPFYGVRKITATLRHEGLVVNHKAVARHMRHMGLAAIYTQPSLSKRQPQADSYPYLLRHVQAAYPNHVWGVDITYVRMRHGWLYLVAVLDWFSRFIVSWALDQTLELPFVMEAVDAALAQATPVIWNSDQGSHFTSALYTQRLQAAGIQISRDGRGRALDNIFTERLWRTIKYEEVYLNDYPTPREARRSLAAYIQFYNHERLHQALGYKPPAQVYFP